MNAPNSGIRWVLALLLWPVPAALWADEQEAATREADIARCLDIRRSQPAEAVALARGILAGGRLPTEDEIKAQACLGYAAGLAGDFDAATGAALRIEVLAADDALRSGDRLRALSNVGSIHHLSGNIQQALVSYLQAYSEGVAKAEAEAEDDGGDLRALQISTLNNIGLIHADSLGAHDVAETYYRKAANLLEDGEPSPVLRYNRAVNLIRTGDASAAGFLARARDDALAIDSALLLARLDAESAGLMIGTPRQDEAGELLEDAIALQRTLPDPTGRAVSLGLLARLQLARGDPQAALADAEAAMQLAEESRSVRGQVLALEARIDALRALRRYPETTAAVEELYRRQAQTLRDTHLDNLALLQAQMQDAAGVREIERMRHESLIQAMTLDRERMRRNWAIALASVLVVAGTVFALFQRRVNRRLRHLSTVDGLTGLTNRRAATGALRARSGAREQGDRRDVLMLIDIDHFKRINDRHGHAVGDHVLIDLAQRLRAACRPDDVVARWGGEEFLVACRDVDLALATGLAERLRRVAEGVTVPVTGREPATITVSIGFAPYPFFPALAPATTWQDAARLADRALYAAKHAGRDAWAGLWGLRHVAGGDIDAVIADPERAALEGKVTIAGHRPLSWHPSAAGMAPQGLH